jgi:hypothetical protein
MAGSEIMCKACGHEIKHVYFDYESEKWESITDNLTKLDEGGFIHKHCAHIIIPTTQETTDEN